MTRRRIVRLLPVALTAALTFTAWLAASPRGTARAGGPAGGNPPASADAPAYVAGEILIRFKSSASAVERTAIRADLGASRVRSFARSVEQLRLGRGRTTEEAVARYRGHPAVEFVEPNYLWRPDTLPSDPYLDDQYGLHNVGQTGGTPGADIGTEQAWDLTTGSREVLVGVIDSGIDYTHPDLAPNIWTNPGEIPGNGVDDDGNGYVDDVHGWDFANDDNDPFDDLGHGTHVAGTIGAVGDNRVGVAGVAWKVRLVPLKFIAASGFGTTADAVAAVEYATAMGVDITNNSWGGGGPSVALLEAIRAAADADVLFVAAAGNDGYNNDTIPHYPSSYDSPNIIAVTAVDHNDARPLFANIGPRSVHLAAPGVNVLSTLPGGVYGFSSGTSMAAPHVAGAAALVRSMAPYIGVVELKQLLLDHVDPLPNLGSVTVSGGRLDIGRALEDRDQVPPGAIVALAAGDPSSNSVVLTWTATGDDGDQGTAAAYEVRYAPAPIDETTFPRATRFWDTPRPGPSGAAERIEVTGLDPGADYHFAIRALDEWGNRGPVTEAVTATTLPPPSFASSPQSFELTLFAGQSATRSLDISNAGAGTLDWERIEDKSAPWLSVSPTGGRLGPGAGARLTLTVETRGLAAGRFEAAVDLSTNDPLVPVARHAVTVDVASAPAVAVSPSSLDFGEVFVGGTKTLVLQATNFGTETLRIDDVRADTSEVSVEPAAASVPAGGAQAIEVTFAPSAPGLLSAALTLSTDAPDAASVVVPLGGSAAPPPAIDVDPQAIDAAVLARTVDTRVLRISNPGPSPLVVDLRFEAGQSPGTLIASPLVNGGFETGDFTGWQALDNNLFGRLPWAVSPAGAGLFENSAPFEGTRDALNGFDGAAGLQYDLVQNLAIPAGVTRADLSFYDRVQWDDLGLPGRLNRIYEATIEKPNGAILALIVHEELEFDASGYRDLGWQRRSIDLLPWAGQAVRLHMRQLVREALTGPAQVEFDAFHIDIEGFPSWLLPAARRVVVDPGSSADVEIRLDASDLLTADYDAFIRLDTNVPATPTVLVPVHMVVSGLPDLDVRGQILEVQSVRDFTTRAATTQHVLALPHPPGGKGTIELIAEADLGDTGESASLSVEGLVLGAIGHTGSDCVETVGRYDLDAARMAQLGQDGVVQATVVNSSLVDPVCYINRHTVRLSYEARADRLDFGTVYSGSTGVLALTIHNAGTAPLEIASIGSDAPAFLPSLGSVTLPVGASVGVDVAFTPPVAGSYESLLTITSDDPDEPVFQSRLVGQAVAPPEIRVDPSAVDLELPVGGRQVTTLHITNPGGVPLEFAASVDGAGPSFASLAAGAGSVAAGGLFDLDLTLDAAGLAPGSYDASIEITGADAVTSPVSVPVRLGVVPAPDIVVDGRRRSAESSAEYTGSGASTTQSLTVAGPAGHGATLHVTLIGDFGEAGETATVRAEGLLLGTVGASGQDCIPLSVDFPIADAAWAALAADGVVHVQVQNAASVGDACAANLHAARLSWREPIDPLDFGATYIGQTSTRQIVVGNDGTDPLAVTAIRSTLGGFVVADESFGIEPGEEHALELRFEPGLAGVSSAQIEIESDDPDEPVVVVAVTGRGLDAPALAVDPASLDVTLAAGSQDTRVLTIENVGAGTLHLAARPAASAPGFVGVAPASATLAPGSTTDLVVRVDATGLVAGSHATSIVLESDDPARPTVGVPLHITVTGASALALSLDELDFGETFVGAPRERALLLTNTGAAPLQITSVVADDPDFEPRPLPPSLAPGGSAWLRVVFRPSAPGPRVGSVELTSDDPTRPVLPIAVQGVGVSPPGLAVDPVRLDATVATGDVASVRLEVSNPGSAPLELRLLAHPDPRNAPAAAADPGQPPGTEPVAPAPGRVACLVSDPRNRALFAVLDGEDGFWRFDAVSGTWAALASAPVPTTDACGAALVAGRVYVSWADRSEIGVYDVDADAWWTVPSPLPGTTAIAGDDAGRLYVMRDGLGRRLDPRSGTVGGIAAPPHDFGSRSVLVGSQGQLYGHRGDGSLWFVRYDPALDRWFERAPLPPGGARGAAAIDPVAGDYFTLASGANGSTVLLRHALREDVWHAETTPVFDTGGGAMAWLPDPVAGIFLARGAGGPEMARRVTRPAFVAPVPHAATVPPGATVEIAIALDATDRFAGVYHAELELSRSNGDEPRVSVPVEMSVTGAPEIVATPGAVDFGEVFAGTTREAGISIDNRGTDRLVVRSVTIEGTAEVSASPSDLVVGPHESAAVTLRFAPASSGPLDATVRIESDDPDHPLVSIPVSGTSVDPPRLVLDPAQLDATLTEGTQLTRSLHLANDGLGALDFSVTLVPESASFVQVQPTEGHIAPGDGLDVAVSWDAAVVGRGVHPAELRLATNDPFRPSVTVPATLTVVGVPDIAVGRAPVTVESSRAYTGVGTTTVHALPAVVPPAGSGTLEIVADGDFGNPGETVTLTGEGRSLGVAGPGSADCGAFTTAFAVPAETLAFLAADGVIEIEARNSDGVRSFCPTNRHTVRLSYVGSADRLDYGIVFLGATRELNLILENLGTAPLEIGPLATDAPEFEPVLPELVVAPGATASLPVRFRPSAVGSFQGVLPLLSNDPDQPRIDIPLVGEGAEAPSVDVEPRTLDLVIAEGGQVVEPLTLVNDGSGPLDFSLAVVPPQATFVRPDSPIGSVGPASRRDILVSIDATELTVGAHQATLEISTNDPAEPRIVVPVEIEVVAAPNLAHVGERVSVESEMEFTTTGALTRHVLPITIEPADDGQIEVVADGDYGQSIEFAFVSAEGQVIGSVGGVGPDCVPAYGIFGIDAGQLAALVDDDQVEIEVQNAVTVDPGCPVNAHTVRLVYRARGDRVDFGTVFVGQSRSRSLTLINRGHETLDVQAIAAEPAAFRALPSAVALAPGESASVDLEFAPDSAGDFTGTLIVQSNDPDTPRLDIPLLAAAADAPVLGVSTLSIERTLLEGQRDVADVTLTNSGPSVLDFSAELLEPETFEGGYTLFGTDAGGGSLYTIDPETGRASIVGVMGIGAPSLAVDPTTGVMYVGQGGGLAVLYTVDPTSAVIRYVGDSRLGEAALEALDFDASGNLYAAVNTIDGPGTGGNSLARIDKQTGVATLIGPFGNGIGTAGGPPGIAGLAFDPATGTLYGASAAQAATVGPPALYTVDPDTGVASFVARVVDSRGQDVPGGVGSLQFLPDGTLLGGTARGTGNLIRIDPVTGQYTLIGNSVTGALGGLALRKNPANLSFIDVTPLSGAVAGFDSRSLELTFDARALTPGTYRARLVVRTNDPDRPSAEIPLGLTVVGVPDIAVAGEPIVVESARDYSVDGAHTSHDLVLPRESAGGATVELVVDGDYGAASEAARLVVGDLELGSVGNSGADCFAKSDSFVLAARDFAEVSAGGTVHAEVINSDAVGAICQVNRHTVRVRYDAPLERVDFGTVFVGYPRTVPVRIANHGRAALEISSIDADPAEIDVGTPSQTLQPFATIEIPVTFAPVAPGALSGQLVIHSNDPDEPEVNLTLVGAAIGVPVAEVQPGSIAAALPPHGDRPTRRVVRLRNSGTSDLVWNAEMLEVAPVAVAWEALPKGDGSADGEGALRPDRTGGPDSFGYRFADSDGVEGPRLDWIEIGQTGTPLSLAGDDENSGPVPIGFDFPFYGETFDVVYVSSNGWLSFTSDQTSYGNAPQLPHPGPAVPENLLAPFWDDLDLRGVQAVRYDADGSRFVVQYTDVGRFGSSASLTFQVVLYPSGHIVFQYLSMLGVLDSATVGIQNGARTSGLLVAYNQDYVHDGLAIEFAPITPWATVEPRAGRLAPGGEANLVVDLRSDHLDQGVHTAELLVRSNDPARAGIAVPVDLRTTVIEAADFEVHPQTLNPGARARTVRAVLELPPGFDPRDVVLSSVLLQEAIPPQPGPVSIGDEDGDGVEELTLYFDRRALVGLLGSEAGPNATVSISGEVAGQAWFTGSTTVQVLSPPPRNGRSR